MTSSACKTFLQGYLRKEPDSSIKMINKKQFPAHSTGSRLRGGILFLLMIGVVGLLLVQQMPAGKQNAATLSQGTSTLYLPLISIPRPKSAFGIETNPLMLSGSLMMNRANDLGIGWARLNDRISWANLQPVEGGPILWDQLTNFENELRALKRAQITPIVIIDGYPYWATIEPNSCTPIRADKFQHFATFLSALVQRYKLFGVHDWELGNEPDVDPSFVGPDSVFGCWGDIDDPYYGGGHYGEMLKVVTPAIREADPLAQVWLGGLLLDNPETTDPTRGKPELFLQGILEAGAADYFDIVPYHSYPPYVNQRVDHDNNIGGPWDAWGGGFVGKATFLRQMMAQYGVEKPLFLNETGMMCPDYYEWCVPSPNADYYQAQADFIVRGFVRAAAHDIKGPIWYTLNRGWRYTGLLDVDGNPLPAYNAYQVLNQQLAGASYKEVMTYAPGVEAYAFQKNAEQIDVLWAMQDQVLDVLVPQNKFVQAYDQYGNSLTPAPVDSNYRLSVGFEPIYIIRLP